MSLLFFGPAMLFVFPAHAHGGQEKSAASVPADAQAHALPRFSAMAGDFELSGVLQPAEPGRRTRELQLHLQPRNGAGSLDADAARLEVVLDDLALQARANGGGNYSLILPVGLSGQVALQVRISQGGLNETVTASLNLDEDAAEAAEAAKKSRGPSRQVLLAGLLTLVIFFIGALLSWREHRGRKRK
ncbi:conserved exported protein of unknown function [Sterolibacterium denitrificans]|uniref:Uncharacterized protein n=2 Tax=Sterolibacterium denitrificans TaxID=157592 RepID=A0A656Z740_9PROT|nr:hypothetical protein [Sterolibacterium denitrificans]KYC28862.1 hypothetical protein ACY05_04090 [Sterolibacterium denitrificans]SMB21146.1 conserved exported protein of unknown function [Sterolibacterium denitrificans]